MLAAIFAVTLGLAACGGDGGGGDEDASKVISETFSSKKEVNSGKLDMNVSAELEGSGAAAQLDGPVTIKLAGPFQTRGDEALPEVDLDLSVSGGGQTFTAGASTTGDAAFISYQGTDYRVPENQFRRLKRQIERDARRDKNRSNNFTFAQLGINPADWIENPKNEGTEEVGGAQTIHVTADVNVAAFVNDLDDLLGRASSLGVQNQQLPRSLTDRQKKQIEEAIQDVQFDLWTGEDDKILRRIELEFGFDVPKQPAAGHPGRRARHGEDGARDRGHQRRPGDQGAHRRASAVRAAERARAGGFPRWLLRRQPGRWVLGRRLLRQRLLRRRQLG